MAKSLGRKYEQDFGRQLTDKIEQPSDDKGKSFSRSVDDSNVRRSTDAKDTLSYEAEKDAFGRFMLIDREYMLDNYDEWANDGAMTDYAVDVINAYATVEYMYGKYKDMSKAAILADIEKSGMMNLEFIGSGGFENAAADTIASSYSFTDYMVDGKGFGEDVEFLRADGILPLSYDKKVTSVAESMANMYEGMNPDDHVPGMPYSEAHRNRVNGLRSALYTGDIQTYLMFREQLGLTPEEDYKNISEVDYGMAGITSTLDLMDQFKMIEENHMSAVQKFCAQNVAVRNISTEVVADKLKNVQSADGMVKDLYDYGSDAQLVAGDHFEVQVTKDAKAADRVQMAEADKQKANADRVREDDAKKARDAEERRAALMAKYAEDAEKTEKMQSSYEQRNNEAVDDMTNPQFMKKYS